MFSVRGAYRLAMRLKYGMGDIGSSSSTDGSRRLWKKFGVLRSRLRLNCLRGKLSIMACPPGEINVI